MIGIVKNETGVWASFNGQKVEVRVNGSTLQFFDNYCSKWVDTTTDKITILEGPLEIFFFEGVAFIGNMNQAHERYNRANPDKKFFIWLQDVYPQLKMVTK